jgi:hypothetical protein
MSEIMSSNECITSLSTVKCLNPPQSPFFKGGTKSPPFSRGGDKSSPFEKGGLRGIYIKDIFLTAGSDV